MDIEKQRQRRHDDARLTKSENARSKQLNTRGAYRVANQQSLACLSGSECRRPGWFLDIKYQTCFCCDHLREEGGIMYLQWLRVLQRSENFRLTLRGELHVLHVIKRKSRLPQRTRKGWYILPRGEEPPDDGLANNAADSGVRSNMCLYVNCACAMSMELVIFIPLCIV